MKLFNNVKILFAIIFLSITIYRANTLLTKFSSNLKDVSNLKLQSLKTHPAGFTNNDAKKLALLSNIVNCATGKQFKSIKSCKNCMKPNNDSNLFFFFQTSRYRFKKLHEHRFTIHVNDKDEEVTISFAGPPVNFSHWEYINGIYKSGFTSFQKGIIGKIEHEYSFVYYRKLKHQLTTALDTLFSSGRKRFKYYCTGYGAGAPLAVIACLDLTLSGPLNRFRNMVTVYTYGGLRVGDEAFNNLLNNQLDVYKIVNKNDFVTKVPHCYPERDGKTWGCINDDVLNKFVSKSYFPLKKYFLNYSETIRKENKLLLVNLKPKNKKNTKNTKTNAKNIKTIIPNKTVKSNVDAAAIAAIKLNIANNNAYVAKLKQDKSNNKQIKLLNQKQHPSKLNKSSLNNRKHNIYEVSNKLTLAQGYGLNGDYSKLNKQDLQNNYKEHLKLSKMSKKQRKRYLQAKIWEIELKNRQLKQQREKIERKLQHKQVEKKVKVLRKRFLLDRKRRLKEEREERQRIKEKIKANKIRIKINKERERLLRYHSKKAKPMPIKKYEHQYGLKPVDHDADTNELLKQNEKLKYLLQNWNNNPAERKKEYIASLLNHTGTPQINTNKKIVVVDHRLPLKPVTPIQNKKLVQVVQVLPKRKSPKIDHKETLKAVQNYKKFIITSQPGQFYILGTKNKINHCKFNSINKIPYCALSFRSLNNLFNQNVHDSYFGYNFETCKLVK